MNLLTRRGERGQELVEFALTFSTLFLVLMGILDMGRMVYYQSTLEYATRVGARYGIVSPDDSAGITDAVMNSSYGMAMQSTDVLVEQLDLYTDTPGTDTIRVSASYRFVAVTPVIGSLVGPDRWITAQATMRMEK